MEVKLYLVSIWLPRSTKAETHDATNSCDMSPRQVAATNRLVWHVNIIVAATEFCRCDLSHEFKLVWIRPTYRSDKISASSLVAPCVRICDKSHQLVSRHVKFELAFKIDYVHRTSFLSQRLVAGSVQTRGLVAAMCRSDLSHRVSRPFHFRIVNFLGLCWASCRAAKK